MKDSTERAPKIGYWWCFCCQHDLEKIETEEDIAEIESTRQYHQTRVWKSREEALVELMGRPDVTDEEIEASE